MAEAAAEDRENNQNHANPKSNRTPPCCLQTDTNQSTQLLRKLEAQSIQLVVHHQ
jgi:hypothetical protein